MLIEFPARYYQFSQQGGLRRRNTQRASSAQYHLHPDFGCWLHEHSVAVEDDRWYQCGAGSRFQPDGG